MELLLNLAWLLLALPAFWLWRDSRSVPRGRRFTALQCLLALGCMLVVLFPIVSATDDLRAMRNEMEESPASKRTIRQATHEKVWPGSGTIRQHWPRLKLLFSEVTRAATLWPFLDSPYFRRPPSRGPAALLPFPSSASPLSRPLFTKKGVTLYEILRWKA